MYRNIKTSSTIFTACPEALTSRFESWTARNLVRFQIVTANLNLEVLQWPGGSLIAPLLWLCAMARSFWLVGTVARLHLRGSHADPLCIARQSGRQTRQSLDQLMSDHLRFTCHAITVLPSSTAMTILVPGPGNTGPAESPMSEISRLLSQICGPGKLAKRFTAAAGDLHGRPHPLDARVVRSRSLWKEPLNSRCREGIEDRHYLAEFKEFFENRKKVTLNIDPRKAWLLVEVLGHLTPSLHCEPTPI